MVAGIPADGRLSRWVRPPGHRGYDYGRPGYNPGGIGGRLPGGVRPGLGVGGFGPGR